MNNFLYSDDNNISNDTNVIDNTYNSWLLLFSLIPVLYQFKRNIISGQRYNCQLSWSFESWIVTRECLQQQKRQKPKAGHDGAVHQQINRHRHRKELGSIRDWEAETRNAHLCVICTDTHALRTRARAHWCAVEVAALADVSMLRLQSAASFAGVQVTSFLDGAASLCPFVAAPRACRGCLGWFWRLCSVATPSRYFGTFHCLFALLLLLHFDTL